MNDTNVDFGMVPHRKNCRCQDCEIERLREENNTIRTNFALKEQINEHNIEEIERLRNRIAELENPKAPTIRAQDRYATDSTDNPVRIREALEKK